MDLNNILSLTNKEYYLWTQGITHNRVPWKRTLLNLEFLDYSYDVFGRPLKEIYVYDSVSYPTKEYVYYFDGISPEEVKVMTREVNNTDQTYDGYQFLNGFEKIAQVKIEGTEDRQIVTDTFYDEFGKVIGVSNPYFVDFNEDFTSPNMSVKGTNYTYDAWDRIIETIKPDLNKTITDYKLWNVTYYDENGNRIDNRLNAKGKIVEVKEYNGGHGEIGSDYWFSSGGEVYLTTYNYDVLGNLISITDAEGNNWTFFYDSLGRKIAGFDPDTGWTNYTYDGNGNIVSQTSGSGNLVTGDGLYREYNELGQLVRVRDGDTNTSDIIEEYTYDHEGNRVKTYKPQKDETVYTPFKEFMQIRNSSGVFNYTYIYDDDGVLVARINPDGSKWFYHNDHLGSTSIITDENGSVVEETDYFPYGSVLEGGESEIKLYEDKELDDTGQYYYGARYYDPELRFFVQSDTMIPNVYDPQQLNIYAFERGNPYGYVDESGNAGIGIGISPSGVFSGYVSGSSKLYFIHDNSENLFQGWSLYKEGISTSQSGGIGLGVSISDSLAFSYLPDVNTPQDVKSLEGVSSTYGGSGGNIWSIGGDFGFSKGKIQEYTFYFGLGIGAEVHGGLTSTLVEGSPEVKQTTENLLSNTYSNEFIRGYSNLPADTRLLEISEDKGSEKMLLPNQFSEGGKQ